MVGFGCVSPEQLKVCFDFYLSMVKDEGKGLAETLGVIEKIVRILKSEPEKRTDELA